MKFSTSAVAISGLVAYVSAAATTVFPSAASSTTLSAPISVSGTYDGGMKRFSRNSREPLVIRIGPYYMLTERL